MNLGGGGNITVGGPSGSLGGSGAFNGVSVDPGTNQVMLGDFSGDPLNGPSKLTNYTSLPLAGFILDWISSFIQDGEHQRIRFDDEGLALAGRYNFPTNRNATLFFRETSAANSESRMYQTTDRLLLEMVKNAIVNSAMEFLDNGQVVYRGITLPGTAPEADVTFYGSVAFRTVFQEVSGNVAIGGNGNFSVWSNGAGAPFTVDVTTPSPTGCRVTVSLNDATQVDISGTANIIKAGALVTAAGAPISSNTAGSSITLECVQSGVPNPIWQATSLVGTWFV